jgi:hypothetical protein
MNAQDEGMTFQDFEEEADPAVIDGWATEEEDIHSLYSETALSMAASSTRGDRERRQRRPLRSPPRSPARA